MKRHCPFFLVIVVALTLFSGCTTLAFRYLDTIIVNKLDDYFKFDKAQKQALYGILAPEIRWLKDEGFGRAIVLLEELAKRVGRGFSATDIDWMTGEVAVLRRLLGDRLVPPFARFSATVTPDQARRAAGRFTEDDEKLLKELARPAVEREKRRFSEFIDRFEDWFGSVDRAQRSEWERSFAKIPDNRSLSLRLRREGQGAYLAAISARRPAGDFEKLLYGWIIDHEASRPAWYRDAADRESAAWREFMLGVSRRLTERQRAAFVEKCREWAGRLRGLRG
jgi:hypothetical protein